MLEEKNLRVRSQAGGGSCLALERGATVSLVVVTFLLLHDSFMGLGCSSVVDQVLACSKPRAQSLVLWGTGR